MGTSSSPAEFVAKIKAAERGVDKANKASVFQCATVLTTAANANIAAATGGDGVLSGMGRSKNGKLRGRITAAQKTFSGYGSTEAVVQVLGPGPLVENDVKPHTVFPKGARVTGRSTRTKSYRNRAGRRTNFNLASAYADAGFGDQVNVGPHRLKFGNVFLTHVVASSKGRHPWRNAREEAEPTFPRIFAANQAKGVAEAFR